MLLFQCCQKAEDNILIEDTSLPDRVKVRYEVYFDRMDLFDLSIAFTDGKSSYNFDKSCYENTEERESSNLTNNKFWEFETEINKGAILFIGASVISKEGVSATAPAAIHVSIYVDNKLVKYDENYLHSSCEYIYGAQKQIERYYLYSK